MILSFWNDINCFSQTAPVAGESGWTYNLPGRCGSALPVTTHSESWNLYLLSSKATMSMTIMYLVSGSSPDTLILITGNILLQKKIIGYIQTKLFGKKTKICYLSSNTTYVHIQLCIQNCIWGTTNYSRVDIRDHGNWCPEYRGWMIHWSISMGLQQVSWI